MESTKTLFAPKPLPYSYNALESVISERLLTLHHDKHYEGYVTTLNTLIKSTPYEDMSLESIMMRADGAIFNNAAQVWNHEFYFEQFSNTPQNTPSDGLMTAIEHSFGSFEYFKTSVEEAAKGLFGSGWVWLVADLEGDLILMCESNAGNPMGRGLRPILTVDVWEHAYYTDYENRRVDAVNALWSIIDWGVIDKRF